MVDERIRREEAVRLARVVAVVVLVITLAGLVIGHVTAADVSNSPTSRTVVTTDPKTETTREVAASGPTSAVKSTETTATRQVTEVYERDGSWFGVLLQNRATFWLVELLAALVVAFVAGAAVQRIWVGSFDFKFGPFQLDPLPPLAADEVPVVKPIAKGEVPDDAIPIIATHSWLSQRPDPGAPAQVLFEYQMVRLQAAVRNLAGDGGSRVQLSDVINELYLQDVDPGFLANVMQLNALAARVLRGATVSDDVSLLLTAAFDRTIDRVLLRAFGVPQR